MSDKTLQGRPSEYTSDIASAICYRLAAGESLRSVCRDDEMPPESTVRQWVVDDREGFSAQYARARDFGLDALADETLEIADTCVIGEKRKTSADGVEVTTGDMVDRSRLRVDARKWYLSKLAPKKYGDRLDLNPDKDRPQHTKSAAAADALVALLISKGASEQEIRAALADER